MKWSPDYDKIRAKVIAAHADDDYIPTLKGLADRCQTSIETLNTMRKAGLVLPVRTRNGYNFSEFKKAFEKFHERQAKTEYESLKDKKTEKEIERLAVNIKIDNERLKQVELETKRQKGELMPVAEHKQKMIAAAQLYVTSIEQGIENASTQMRSAEMRAVLEKVFNAVRKRVARSIEG